MSEVTFGRAGVAAPSRDNSYEGKRSKPCGQGSLSCLAAAFVTWKGFGSFAPWFAGGDLPGTHGFALITLAALLLALGAMRLIAALRGLPRLTVGREGIEIETLFGATWANWNSLGLFEGVARRSGRLSALRGEIVGAAVSSNLQRKSQLRLTNDFATPLATILADIHQHQPRLRAQAGPVAATVPPVEAEQNVGIANFSAPWLSFLILIALGLIFYAEQLYGIEASDGNLESSITSLIALGGLNRTLIVENGEWYRLFTAPLLHGDLSHIIGNGVALIIAGYQLERLVGRLWFFAFFVIGAFGGALLSLVSANAAVSVGASGAITGLFAAAYLSSFRLSAGDPARWGIQLRSALIALPALAPLVTSAASNHVDYGAHLGGVVSGAAAAMLLFRAWPDTSPLPGGRVWAAALALLGMIFAGDGGIEVAEHYPHYSTIGTLVPERETPKDPKQWKERAGALALRYPADPRGHFYRGIVLAEARDLGDAERELRMALERAQNFHFIFGAPLETLARGVLAAIVHDEGRQKEAREIAQPLCQTRDQLAAPAQKLLADGHFCEG